MLRKKIKPDAAGQGAIVNPDGKSKPVRLAPCVLILRKFPDKSVITMPQEAATTGERGDSDETFSAPAAVITAKVSRQVPVIPEPFASADEAAQFLCVKRRYLLELARRGIAGAYALGTGGKRKIWVFRLSELAASVVQNETSIPKPLCEGRGLRVPFLESARPCSPLRVCFRRRSSATGGKEGRSAYRGRPTVRTSQPASQPKQLASEQGESRTEDRAGHSASRKDSDDARSVHAGGLR